MSSLQNQTFIDSSKVVIKPLAYYKMLVHVLRFGTKIKHPEVFRECMGMLIGELRGSEKIKDVIIHDAIPINHGGQIEVKFAEHDYIAFAEIDTEFAEKGWFSVGWYHSHPGLGVFFSAVDIRNQLGFQVPNPSAVGIVFDHELLENHGNMGLKVFRLDDPNRDMTTGYHEVKFIVEPPNSVEFFDKIKNLIDSIHKKEPVIFEINETPDIFGDISIPSQSQMRTRQPEMDLMGLLQSFNEGISKFSSLFFEPLIRYLNQWGQNTNKLITDINLQMRENLIALKDNLSNGLSELHTWNKFAIMDIFRDIEIYIDDKFELIDTNKEALKSSVNKFKESVETRMTKLFADQINLMIEDVNSLIKNSEEKFSLFKSTSNNNINQIIQNNKSINEISRKISNFNKDVAQDIDSNSEKVKRQLDENFKSMLKDINEVTKKQEDFVGTLDTALTILEKVIKSFQKLKENMNKNQGGS